ncbi:hypothetical protein ACFLS9_04205 [Bacteroidota bacterium]
MKKLSKKNWSLFALIILLAAGLRIWGIDYGLPYIYHPDEPGKVRIAQRMFKTGDLNPKYFSKPTFFIYLNTALYLPYYFIGKTIGKFEKTRRH